MRPARLVALLAVFLALAAAARPAPPAPAYVKKGGRVETVVASLRAAGLPALDGPWHYIGPFDNSGGEGYDTPYPPEREIDLAKTYPGKDSRKVGWKAFKDFRLGQIVNLKKFDESDYCCVYLFHEIDAAGAVALPVSLGSDDTLTVWLNGEKLVEENTHRAAAPGQNHALLQLKPGKNRLLLKVCNFAGEWQVYVAPELPPSWPAQIREQLDRDFGVPGAPASADRNNPEARYYRLATVPVPRDIVMEVGGLAFRPDGKLLACTRRGEVWLITKPAADDLGQLKCKLFATGLHEPLGLCVDGRDVYVVQRPELTKLVDRDGDDVADEYVTVCDKWGVSGDYHEFAFGPARDRQGNFYVTLNVGFGGGHQSKAPWRGWCVKITPKGELLPYATGLRSPNGINVSPEGDLFYCDNQGEWTASCKLHHVRQGEYYGHPAGLRWAKLSPFAALLPPESHAHGMLYDGQKGTSKDGGFPPHVPPAVWFPYGRMGQSASEPVWDTTGGKFGPFAGQCFVGDQTKSMVMRVVLEKVNGRYQGACLPFRGGFDCGINRLAFGPDGTLYAGQTNRGWGSVGGKPYGLQRLTYTGVLPFEIYAVKLTRRGFDLTFTKPLNPATAGNPKAYSVQSFTYNYWPTYGSPEVDRRPEKVTGVAVSTDGKGVSLAVDGFRRGRVYELHLEGVRSRDGDPVLHPEAYYTLNEIPQQ
jgi:hypothetical protein